MGTIIVYDSNYLLSCQDGIPIIVITWTFVVQAKKVKSRPAAATVQRPKPITPVIRQILDMGFTQHHIEHAITCKSILCFRFHMI